MRTRIGWGDRVSLAGAVLLIVSLFLHWYRLSGAQVSASATAFQALSVVDVVLLAIGVLAIVLVLAVAVGRFDAAYRRTVLGGGVVAAALVVFALARPPGDMSAYPEEIRADVALTYGGVVALIASAALIAGQIVAMRRWAPGAEADVADGASS